jgi:hypothetical protein
MKRSVALCGSMALIDEMEDLARELERVGYGVETPQREEVAIDWDRSGPEELARLEKGCIDAHLVKIRRSDVVLLANHEKHGVAGYVGPNTLMEAAFGYARGLPVVLRFDPGDQPCTLELAAMARLVLGGRTERLEELRGD